MNQGHSVKITFCAKGKCFDSFEEFLECFSEIHLTKKETSVVKEFLNSFCCTVLQEWELGYDLGDTRRGFLLTLYLSSIVSIDNMRRWYLSPIDGLKLFFYGLEVVCIYDISRTSN